MGGSDSSESSCPLPTADLPVLPDFQFAPIYRPYPPEAPKGPPVELYVKGKDDPTAVHDSDLMQRGLNDCFFVASLAAVLRSHPDPDAFLRDIIKDNGNGTYTVRFFEFLPNGQRRLREVTVNTDFKGALESDDPKERWGAVIEKAYVKAFGNCNDIYEGNPANAMAQLTGIESTAYPMAIQVPALHLPPSLGFPDPPPPTRATLEGLATLRKNGYAATLLTFDHKDAGAKQDAYQKQVYAQQLHAHHTYTLTDVDVKKGTITVHNPWDQKVDIVIPFAEAEKLFTTVQVNPVVYAGPKDPNHAGQMQYPVGMPSYPHRAD